MTSSEPGGWRGLLEQPIARIRSNPDDKRAWTFDMDDLPELKAAAPFLPESHVLLEALRFLGGDLTKCYQLCDSAAIGAQGNRRWMARLAIIFGIGAVVLAVVQLELTHLAPGLVTIVTLIEVFAIVLAAAAIVIGNLWRFHPVWLAKRQAAERLRSLKFQSLGWHELWNDLPAWKLRVQNELARLAELTAHHAEQWATEADDVAPAAASNPDRTIDESDVTALADYYRVKRLEYQKQFFDIRAASAQRHAWANRWKISVVAFWASVGAVFLHGILALFLTFVADPAVDHSGAHHLEIILIGFAVLLPIIGFGFRAWSAAFEFPRNRNLFRAKSSALKFAIDAIQADRKKLHKTLTHIAECEHFLLGEHREWCRLQIEAEWFV